VLFAKLCFYRNRNFRNPFYNPRRRDLEAELEATKRIFETLKVQQGNIDLDKVGKNKEK